jgi:hypothetical protein
MEHSKKNGSSGITVVVLAIDPLPALSRSVRPHPDLANVGQHVLIQQLVVVLLHVNSVICAKRGGRAWQNVNEPWNGTVD